MSDLRIALVAEGTTDYILIEEALKAILRQRTFVLTLLQPDTSDAFGGAGVHGGGWGGVYRWCRKVSGMDFAVNLNPSLTMFDLVILHLDADVAGMRYQDANIYDGFDDLPCQLPCPPAAATVNNLRRVMANWLGLPETAPDQWVFCIPSKSIEAWLVAALYGQTETNLIQDIECYPGLESWLAQRPIREGRLIRRNRKQVKMYRQKAPILGSAWGEVCRHCTQAARFDKKIQAALH